MATLVIFDPATVTLTERLPKMNCSETLVALCVAEVVEGVVDGVVVGVVAGEVDVLELDDDDPDPDPDPEDERPELVAAVLLELGAAEVPVAPAEGTISLFPCVGNASTPATPATVPPKMRW